MDGRYLGYVTYHDPLRGFLSQIVRDRLGIRRHDAEFRVFRLSGSNEVYGYQETSSGAKVICKFYGSRFGPDRDKAAGLAAREYEGLERLRGYGLIGSPHHVVRPLGLEPEINGVLATEYYSGETLSQAIARAAGDGDDTHLRHRLGSLAWFLATQHNRTADGQTVDFDADGRYFGCLVERLRLRNRIGDWKVDELNWLRGLWLERPRMWHDRQVWLHGDATPANFLFGNGFNVGAIDLERVRRGDRVFDVGRVAGELQHAFMLVGSPERAEPFIGHFLWEYCGHFPDCRRAFDSLRARVPFYLAMNLLRIAANGYISERHGRRLVREAGRLLRTP
jgi:aminoglycoside phosphotransferase (APT) family kinase protein